MQYKHLNVFLLLAVMNMPLALADVPYTFSNGQAADADEVNANFSALVDQINSLEQQVLALTNSANNGTTSTRSIDGEWLFLTISTTNYQPYQKDGFQAANTVTASAAVLNPDGTFVSIETWTRNNLTIDNDISASCSGTGVQCFFKSYITASMENNVPESNTYTGTYSVEGSVVTFDLGNNRTIQTHVSSDGNTMLYQRADSEALAIQVGIKL